VSDYAKAGDESEKFGEQEDNEGAATLECPYCGEQGDGCSHFLGARDLHFCEELEINPEGPLGALQETFQNLAECIGLVNESGDARLRASLKKLPRFKVLMKAAADEDLASAFEPYLGQLAKASGAAIQETSFDDDGSLPGFSSTIVCYWSPNAVETAAALQRLLEQDVRQLEVALGEGGLADPPDR